MAEVTPPIDQLIRNYVTNLPVFPPADPQLSDLHSRMLEFYRAFCPAASGLEIAEAEQNILLERVQRVLWAFGQAGQLQADENEPCLVLEQEAARALLKFPKAEAVFRVMARLGMTIYLRIANEWVLSGNLKGCDGARLCWPAAQALQALAAACAASSPKDKPAYERFLRANPQAALAREKPPLSIAPDDGAIVANLDYGAGTAWKALVQTLARFDGYAPVVEFRSIHHGLWVVNYESKRAAARDLCGLTVQNGEMTVRVILYRAGHLFVKERLAEFGEGIAAAFHRAHYYEKFEHQWLFVPVRGVEDLPGLEKLLAVMPDLLRQN